MATETLIIRVQADGTRVVSRQITGVGRSARRASSSVDFLKRALIALGGTAVIRSIVRTADAFTQLQNRLRVVTDSTLELRGVTEGLVQVSRETRTSLAANAELFNRLRISITGMGVSQRETLAVTKSLNQAVILSGAAAREARAGLIQLSQGLSRGVLRGDELRSVLEQLPVVSNVIAKQLGVTRQELNALGEQGRITSDQIIAAFQASREELEERFQKTVPTIAQAFQVLNNSLVVFFGQLGQSTELAARFTEAVLFLADNIDRVLRPALIVGLVGALRLTIFTVEALGRAIRRNPLLALGIAITVAGALLFEFRDDIKVTEDGVTSLGDVARATFERIAEAVPFVRQAVEDMLASITESWNVAFGTNLPGTFEGFATGIAGGIDVIIGIFSGLGAAILVAVRSPLETFGLLFIETLNLIIRQLNRFIRFVSLQLQGLRDNLIQIAAAIPGIGAELAQELAQIRVQLPELGELENPFRQQGETIGAAFAEGFRKSTQAQDLVGDIFERAEEIGQERTRGPTEQELENRRRLNEILDETGEITRRTDSSVQSLTNSLKNSEITSKQFGETLGTVLLGTVDQLSGAIADLAISGFQDFESFKEALSNIFRDLAREIVKLIVKFLILKLVSAAFSSGSGGGGGGGTQIAAGATSQVIGAGFTTAVQPNLVQRQAGGPLGAGQAAIVGERGPELFVPDRSGRVVPNTQMGRPEVNVSVVNVTDPEEVTGVLNSSEGEEAILNVISRNSRQVGRLVAGAT